MPPRTALVARSPGHAGCWAPWLLALVIGAWPCGCQPRGEPTRARPTPSAPGTELDREIGRRTDEALLAELRIYDDPKLLAYATGVLERVAASIARTEPWTLRILDTSYVTVRSAPGGYIYVTRGLLAFLGSEAELAGAFAHEVAHVTRRHWRHRMAVLERNGVEDGDLSRLSRAGKLELLAAQRNDEREADELAVELLKTSGYATRGLARVIELFAAFERMAGGARVPPELRTHPATSERLKRVANLTGPAGLEAREQYLAQIDGLPFGEDPRQGYLYGDRYVNPDADFELPLPSPWRAELVGRDLLAALPGKDIVLFFSRSEHGDLRSTETALAAEGTSFEKGELAARPALLGRRKEASGLVMQSALLDTENGVFVLAVVAPTDDASAARVRALLQGAAKIESPELANIAPLRVRIETLSSPMTLREYAGQKPCKTNLATLALLNGVEPDVRLTAGTRIKRIDV